jgi:hypothetical protein
MAFTERLTLIIDAHTGGAVREIRQTETQIQRLGGTSTQTGGMLGGLAAQAGISGQALKAGVAVGALAAGAVLLDLAGNAVSTTSRIQEQVSGANVTFGEFSDAVLDFAANTEDAFFIAESAALQAANQFGALFKTAGFGQQEAAGLSITMTKLAADLASFRDIAPTEALSALRSGLVGEVEPLRRIGVLLSADAVQTKALALGLANANGELSEGAKVAARYALIMEQTTDAQGDQARTSDQLANQQRKLDEQMEQFSNTVGEAVLPAVSGFIQLANDSIGPLIVVLGALQKVNEEMGVLGVEAEKAEEEGGFFGRLVTAAKRFTGAAAVDDLREKTAAAADAAKDAGDSYKGWDANLDGFTVAADGALKKIEGLNDEAGKVSGAFLGARDAEEAYSDALEGIDDAAADLARAKGDLVDATEDETRAQADANREHERAARALQSARFGVERATFGKGEAEEDVADAQRAYNEALNDYGPNSKAARDAADELEDALFAQKEAGFDLEEAQYRVIEAQQNLVDSQEKVEAQSDRVRDAQDRVREAEEKLRDAQDDLGRSAIDLEEALADERDTLSELNAGGSAYLDFLEEVIRTHPEAASSIQPLIDKLKELRGVQIGPGGLGALPIPTTPEEAAAGAGRTVSGQPVTYNITVNGVDTNNAQQVANEVAWQQRNGVVVR